VLVVSDKFKGFALNCFFLAMGGLAVSRAVGYAFITLATSDAHAYQKVYGLSLTFALIADALFYIVIRRGKIIWRIFGILGMLSSLIPILNFAKTYPHVFR